MGRGALRLASDEPLRQGIEAEGWSVACEEIEGVDESGAEIARVTELIRKLGRATRQTVDDGAFPLVLAGNCNSCLGTVAGSAGAGLGVVWFDAHADFDDPDENTSGFFDVMALAMLTGRGWRALRGTIPNHIPVSEPNVLLGAVRDLEPYQRRRLEHSGVLMVPGEIDPERFSKALGELSSRVSEVYLHLDLDSIDISDARANQYAASGGPSLDRLSRCIDETCARFRVVAASITAYDPAFDADDRALAASRRITREIASGVLAQRKRLPPTAGPRHRLSSP